MEEQTTQQKSEEKEDKIQDENSNTVRNLQFSSKNSVMISRDFMG